MLVKQSSSFSRKHRISTLLKRIYVFNFPYTFIFTYFICFTSLYTVSRKKGATDFFAVTFTNIDRFS